jgi:hypothetical protein
MQLEENLTKNKKNVTNLKNQCDKLALQLKSIEDLTRWDNIDQVINIFKYSIAIIILINLTILFLIIVY